MVDIVERLRNGANGLWSENLMHIPTAMQEAADEIAELREIVGESNQLAADNFKRAMVAEAALRTDGVAQVPREVIERAIDAIGDVVSKRDDLGHVHFVELAKAVRASTLSSTTRETMTGETPDGGSWSNPSAHSSALHQCPICARRVASPCETLAIATSCPLSSADLGGGE